MYEAINNFLIAGNNEIFFSFFFISYMHTCRIRVLYLNTEIWVGSVFKLGTCLNRQTSVLLQFSQIAITQNKGLWQAAAGLDLLQAFTFKIINLKSSIWPKYLKIRNISIFHLWFLMHLQFFCKCHRLNCI